MSISIRPVIVAKALVAIVALIGTPIAGVWLTKSKDSTAKAANSADYYVPAGPKAPDTSAISTPFVGVLLSPQMATVSAYVDGRVEGVLVKNGQRVRAHELLLNIDERQQQHSIEEARGTLKSLQGTHAAASSEARAAESQLRRCQSSVQVAGQTMGLCTGDRVDELRAQVGSAYGRAQAAAGQMDSQRARIKQLELGLENCRVEAPFDGFVSVIHVEPGVTIHNGQPLVRMVGGEGLRVRIAVPEDKAGVWNGHRRARIELGDRGFWAVLDQVSPEVDPSSRAYFLEGPVDTVAEPCAGHCSLLGGRPVQVTLISDRQ